MSIEGYNLLSLACLLFEESKLFGIFSGHIPFAYSMSCSKVIFLAISVNVGYSFCFLRRRDTFSSRSHSVGMIHLVAKYTDSSLATVSYASPVFFAMVSHRGSIDIPWGELCWNIDKRGFFSRWNNNNLRWNSDENFALVQPSKVH